ncbi:MAG: helix-turn-helix domain-containing protein, partial [Pseudomonadota bacterium]
YAVQMWRDLHGAADLPEYFVNAQTLAPLDHVRMQAAAQKWVDSSISKTINCPADISFEDFKEVYMAAWDQGCKGCTTYRPNDVTGSVLSVEATPSVGMTVDQKIAIALEASGKSVAEVADEAGITTSSLYKIISGDRPNPKIATAAAIARALGKKPSDFVDGNLADLSGAESEVVYLSEKLDRPEALEGNTYKIKWPESEHAIYITVNDVIVGGQRRPFEVFINSKNMEHFAWTVALTRMISAVFRRGGDVSFVVEELKAVFDPRGGAWMEGRYVPSILAAIGGVIERHMVEIGFLEQLGSGSKSDPQLAALAVGDAPRGAPCPNCGEFAMHMAEGCMTCTSCGFSKCS